LEAHESKVSEGVVPGEAAGSAGDTPLAKGVCGKLADGDGGGCRDRTESGERERGSTDVVAGSRVSLATEYGSVEFGKLDRGGMDGLDLL
jgi:hypothetical protein